MCDNVPSQETLLLILKENLNIIILHGKTESLLLSLASRIPIFATQGISEHGKPQPIGGHPGKYMNVDKAKK